MTNTTDKPLTLQIVYKDSNGVMVDAFACTTHLPQTLLNIQQTAAVHEASKWECDVCAHDREHPAEEITVYAGPDGRQYTEDGEPICSEPRHEWSEDDWCIFCGADGRG